MIVNNFKQLVDVYNQWCVKHNIPMTTSELDLADSAMKELTQLYNTIYDIR